MIARNEQNARPETEYRRHMAALEDCARRLEGMDLDPQEALEVCREAEEHYRAVDRLLTEVEREVDALRRNRSIPPGG